ncbi:hypothetical protein A4G18_07195 [Pasteurellaceae bacterium Pebbles2]|nr:hypothetical protein [Pasteurellaceae bacterium Pebbles2]
MKNVNNAFKLSVLALAIAAVTACSSDYSSSKNPAKQINQPKLTQPTKKAESPKPAAPKAEQPKAETPKPAAPKAEQPKAEAPKPATPKAEAPKPAAPKVDLAKERAKLEENPNTDGKWRVLIGGGVDADRVKIHTPEKRSFEYKDFYTNDNGVVKFDTREMPDVDLSNYEINPQKVQKIADKDNPYPAGVDGYVVNQRYSSYAVWNELPNVQKNPEFYRVSSYSTQYCCTYSNYGAIVTKGRSRFESQSENYVYGGNSPAPIFKDGGSATYKGNVLATNTRNGGFFREDFTTSVKNQPELVNAKPYTQVPADGKIGELTLNADFAKQEINGSIQFLDNAKIDNAVINTGKIDVRDSTFEARLASDSKVLPTKRDFDQHRQGFIKGEFVGPNAEEIVGTGRYENYEDTLRRGEQDYHYKAGYDFIFGATREGEYSMPAVESK